MSYGALLQATIGKRNREQEKSPAKLGTTSSIAARVASLQEVAKKG